ncbi:MAG: hypothetical protein K9M57_10735 [Phycisphaerae bacterium]|nr:hypothetical protein [Phycisphaerae bacterium]
MRTILIGIDDTDNLTSPGTGSLARKLCAELVARGIRSLGVTRHQFLFDRAIPYTSHNSGACIAGLTDKNIEAFDFAFEYVANASAEGSDPGVCIAFGDDVPHDISDFGQAAQKTILQIKDSFNLTRGTSVKLHGLGGDCQGVIGALASVGLRARGNDGRFVDLPGLRDLPQIVNIRDFQNIGVTIIPAPGHRTPGTDESCDTLNWARPDLMDGKPVLIVEWSDNDNLWIPLNRKKKKSSKHNTP